ncbi:hypothetical protein LMG28614_06517 [Paraburkholderia ultramafica]|uniref:Uncharacterized protein n=1 Tax=Paraburkholderia ultramafica TaxID=1544867 RepID=A0A6S7BNY0_9BURK|nr:hypothetical protein LMG28614_06517 [Paraburkholderia ultramafica]
MELLGNGALRYSAIDHLAFRDYMHELDSTQQDPGAAKCLESQHGSGTPLDRPVVLFHDIVEILDLADLDGRLTPGVHGMQPGQIGTTFVDGYDMPSPNFTDQRHTVSYVSSTLRTASNSSSMRRLSGKP